MVSAPGFSEDGGIPSPGGEATLSRGPASAGPLRPLPAALEASPDPALLAEADGTLLAANEAFAATWRFGAAERCDGKALSTVLAEGGTALLEAVAASGRFSGDGRALLADGTELELRLSARRVAGTEPADGQLVVFASDVTAARRLERAAAVLGESLDGPGGDAFFDRLAEGLSGTLRMEMVLVGRLAAGAPKQVRTLAFRMDGAAGEPFTYDLKGAPCERVVGRVPCVFPSHVAELFPEDAVLAQNGFSSYVGVPLSASDGTPLGLLAALSRRPLHDGRPPDIGGLRTPDFHRNRAFPQVSAGFRAPVNAAGFFLPFPSDCRSVPG